MSAAEAPYLAWDAGAKASTDGLGLAAHAVEGMLAELLSARLLVRENERYLSLALPNG